MGNAPDFIIDSMWLDRVEEVANYGFQNDMYVIINLHHDEPWIKLNTTDIDRIYNKFVVNGIPVVLSEWCNIDNDNYADRIMHADHYTKACVKRGITTIWWDTNSSTRLLNRNTLEWVSPEINMLGKK